MDDRELARLLARMSEAFRWAPACSAGEMVAFEAEHRVELPCDYRRFLLEVGNGGAAERADLVFPLGRTTYPGDGPLDDIGRLAAPCPLVVTSEYWRLAADRGAPDVGDDEVDTDTDADDMGDDAEADDDAQERWFDDRWPLDGIVPIGYLGCTQYAYLVTAGPQRGYVWEFDGGTHMGESWGPFCPWPNPLMRSVTFAEWLAIELGRRDWLVQSPR